jgi:ubiquinone/menaquinone biosynthesis C-methylase UbiE
MSRAFFEALDQADLDTVRKAAAPSFVRFSLARFYDLALISKTLQGRIDRKAPPRTRTWTSERVLLTPGAATFIGESVEHVPAEGENPAADLERWNTLVWQRSAEGWSAALWESQEGGLAAERDAWNETLKASIGFKVTPNQFLVDTVKGRKPGTALDVAMGQGRNAVYLATKGWKTTGLDIASEGLAIARANAAKQKTHLETIEADVDTFDFGTAKWDLVTMIYAGDDHATIEKIKPSLKKGGLFVVEYFGKRSTGGSGIGGFDAGELAKLFEGWTILHDEVVEDIADWGLAKTTVVRFAAQKP